MALLVSIFPPKKKKKVDKVNCFGLDARLTLENLLDCVVYRGEDLLVCENTRWSSLYDRKSINFWSVLSIG